MRTIDEHNCYCVPFLDPQLRKSICGSINKFSWKFGGIYYGYPGTESFRKYNYWEIAGSAGYDFDILSVNIGLNYSPDYFAGSGSAWYPYGDITVPLPFLTDYSPYMSRSTRTRRSARPTTPSGRSASAARSRASTSPSNIRTPTSARASASVGRAGAAPPRW